MKYIYFLKHTDLALSFLFCSLIILILPLYGHFFLPELENHLLTTIEIEAQKTAKHLALSHLSFKNEFTRTAFDPSFTPIVVEILEHFNLQKIKAFSRNGETVFSTDTKEIGTINNFPYFRDIVAKGNIYTKVVRKTETTQENQIISNDVVEIYIPILYRGEFSGAFEFYYDVPWLILQSTDFINLYNQLNLFSIPALWLIFFLVWHHFGKDRRQIAEDRIKLAQSRESFLRTMDTALDGIVLLNRKGTIRYWNPAAEQLFGYSNQEVIGQNLHLTLLPPQHLEMAQKEFEQFLTLENNSRNEQNKTWRQTGLHKNGHTLSLLFNLTILPTQEESQLIVFIRPLN
ncbi:MAG: PAS domain-containing protein [Magnetococcus sp. DMHC-6]